MPYDAELEAAREDEVKTKLIEAMEAAAAQPDVSPAQEQPHRAAPNGGTAKITRLKGSSVRLGGGGGGGGGG